MMDRNFPFLLVLLPLFLLSCQDPANIVVRVEIDYLGSSELNFEKQRLHYKYSEPNYFPPENRDGEWVARIPVDSTQVAYLTLGEDRYPLVLQSGANLRVDVKRAFFPDSVRVQGYPRPWDRIYQRYLDREEEFQERISEELPAFREGRENRVIPLFEQRYRMADSLLSGTPLDLYYHKAAGEYLVKRLERITYRRGQEGFSPERERQAVIEKAKEFDFFRFESLHDQRAGIRDFTHAYANTFGVADSLERVYGQELIEYDVKRLGYETLDSARTSVLAHIPGRRAEAYSRMHLVAERIGEMPLEVAEPSYRSFLEEYRSDFPRYASFLETFYAQIKQVTPGQPAIPFTLPNPEGEMVSMSDFRGKYVLLDFWAGWCIPCLDEFPHMRELYRKYPRDRFEIVGISIAEDSTRWRRDIRKFSNPWPQLYGGNGFEQETFDAYRGGGIPFYILINPQGNIERYNDIRPSFNLEAVMDSLLRANESL